jgi:hypothetical protein
MPPLNLRELNSRINAISNELNASDNVNRQRYWWLRGRYVSIRAALTKHFSELKLTKNTTPPAVKATTKKLYDLKKLLNRKYPSLPIHSFTAQSAQYRAHPTVKNRNKVANNRRLNRHEFVNHHVYDLPKDAITLNNINNGNRAIKINKSIYSLQSFRNLTRSAIYDVLRRHGNSILFVDPMTKQTVRRRDITPIKIRHGPSASEIYGNNV